jgi:hypothetical protein
VRGAGRWQVRRCHHTTRRALQARAGWAWAATAADEAIVHVYLGEGSRRHDGRGGCCVPGADAAAAVAPAADHAPPHPSGPEPPSLASAAPHKTIRTYVV